MQKPLALHRQRLGTQWSAAPPRPFGPCCRPTSSNTRSQLLFQYGLLQRSLDARAAWSGFNGIGQLLQFRGDSHGSPESNGGPPGAAAHKASNSLPAELESLSSSTTGALVGASAKQLFQTAAHSLDLFEAKEASSVEEHDAFESMDPHDRGDAAHLPAAYASKANYEVLRLDEQGKVRRLNVRRRDLLREHGLQPRDLRRIDPTIDFTKTSPSITIKENALLLNFGGVRAIVTAERALVFEPNSANTRKLLDVLVPRLQAAAGQRLMQRQAQQKQASQYAQPDYRREAFPSGRQAGSSAAPPFELEVLEAVLMVATGRLDADVLSVTRRVSALLTQLPRNINPVNLEELRRIKQALVELENKADTVRELLEQIMDDEDELRELNLSSRPRREERRRQRERDRLERELERAREAREEVRNSQDSGSDSSNGSSAATSSSPDHLRPHPSSNGSTNGPGHMRTVPGISTVTAGAGTSGSVAGISSNIGTASSSGASATSSNSSGTSSSTSRSMPSSPYAAKDPAGVRRERLAELKAKHSSKRDRGADPYSSQDGDAEGRQNSRLDNSPEEDYQEAQDALEEMAEQEEEEHELEEVEDLLEYYLQRATATQSEAERLLEGARDLEESIGVSLSARRYEVGRLELMLSMGSFAAAIGAMIAGIFGMNLRSTLENSVVGFWGVTAGIVVLCMFVFVAIMRYTQKRRIL